MIDYDLRRIVVIILVVVKEACVICMILLEEEKILFSIRLSLRVHIQQKAYSFLHRFILASSFIKIVIKTVIGVK